MYCTSVSLQHSNAINTIEIPIRLAVVKHILIAFMASHLYSFNASFLGCSFIRIMFYTDIQSPDILPKFIVLGASRYANSCPTLPKHLNFPLSPQQQQFLFSLCRHFINLFLYHLMDTVLAW